VLQGFFCVLTAGMYIKTINNINFLLHGKSCLCRNFGQAGAGAAQKSIGFATPVSCTKTSTASLGVLLGYFKRFKQSE
jgi:hypothetical protein